MVREKERRIWFEKKTRTLVGTDSDGWMAMMRTRGLEDDQIMPGSKLKVSTYDCAKFVKDNVIEALFLGLFGL